MGDGRPRNRGAEASIRSRAAWIRCKTRHGRARHERNPTTVTSFLTTREVQDLLKVDRSTVYRMAEDGRLPGIKVGRQWRFPSERIDAFFGGRVEPNDVPKGGTISADFDGLGGHLPLDATQGLVALIGELIGAMVIITDMSGRPVSGVANPCGLYEAMVHHPGVQSRCVDGWRSYANDLELEPVFRPSHFGFLCARGLLRVGTSLEGMLIVGGYAPPDWPPSPEQAAHIATELGVPTAEVVAHADEVFHADGEQLDAVLSLLPRISLAISQLAASQRALVDRLGLIADLAGA